MENVIFEYTLAQAFNDGVLHSLGWFNGTPLVATAGVMDDLPNKEMRDLFTRFFSWQKRVEPMLPEEERMFSAIASNGHNVWVIDDGAAITLLYPEDY